MLPSITAKKTMVLLAIFHNYGWILQELFFPFPTISYLCYVERCEKRLLGLWVCQENNAVRKFLLKEENEKAPEVCLFVTRFIIQRFFFSPGSPVELPWKRPWWRNKGNPCFNKHYFRKSSSTFSPFITVFCVLCTCLKYNISNIFP